MVFATIGGMGASHLFFRKAYVPSAPSKEASVPKTMSHGSAPVRMFAGRQLIVIQGIASEVKNGRTVKASDSRNWITFCPDNPTSEESNVRAT